MALRMDKTPSPELEKYLTLESDFTDFIHFQGDSRERAAEKEAFLSGKKYVPEYSYPKLIDFPYDNQIQELKTSLLEASFNLYDTHASREIELQVEYIHSELARIALVSAAATLNAPSSSSQQETARNAFRHYNQESYGKYDAELGGSMLRTELIEALNYRPSSAADGRIRDELLAMLSNDLHLFEPERPVMTDEELSNLHDTVWQRYSNELLITPNTSSSTTYTAYECKEILNASIRQDGLAERGWSVEVDASCIVPATYPLRKIIYIPESVQYTSDDIRRILIGHEQKTHAWRHENGHNSGVDMLKKGTAGSLDSEEGLGIITECGIAGSLDNPSIRRARDRYITAGLALGADKSNPRDAREVYETLWRIIALRKSSQNIDDYVDMAKNEAYAHIENAFRGTPFWQKGIIYTKLKVYYEGLVKNVDFLRTYSGDMNQALDDAMIGSYDHTNQEERLFALSSLAAVRPSKTMGG